MIKFFRKIRQNLLSEGKTGKYFKYAIGEIILVVIGILIALSINNWNEDRKNKLAEANYYCRILDDFELNEKLVDEALESTNDKIRRCKELIVDLNRIPNNKSDILNDFIYTLRLNVFVPSRIAFDDLTSSGNLKLLTDLQLKNRLIEYNSFLENTLDLLAEIRNEINKRVLDYELSTEVGIQEFDYLKKELGQEILVLLPNREWTGDTEDPIFIKFQDNLVFLVTMYIRQGQHLSKLKQEMQEPLQLLRDKNCNS